MKVGFHNCPIFKANTTLEVQALPCISYTHILLSFSITKLFLCKSVRGPLKSSRPFAFGQL